MSFSQNNYGIYLGRLSCEPKFFASANGGETVILKIACRRNFRSRTSEEPVSDFAEFRAYIPPQTAGHGIYAYLHTGDLVSVQYCLRTGSSEQIDGTRTYFQSCYIENLEIREGRQVREERLAARSSSGTARKSKKAG